MRRPGYTRSRAIKRSFFSEKLTIRREEGRRVQGIWSLANSDTETTGSTAPPDAGDARVRRVLEEQGGLRLEAMRLFWTVEALDGPSGTSRGDLVIWDGQLWRVVNSRPYGDFWEAFCQREGKVQGA